MASRPPEPSQPASDTVARNRWLTMQVARLTGFGMVIVGILLTQGALGSRWSNAVIAGYVLIGIGLIDGFVVPQILARKWRTPRR